MTGGQVAGVVILALIVGAGAGAGGLYVATRHQAPSERATAPSAAVSGGGGEEADIQPVAPVRTEPAQMGAIAQTLQAYGRVVALDSARQIISVPVEVKVDRLLVSVGQQVKAGEPLVHIEPSPDTRLALTEARSDAALAAEALTNTRERFDMKLATTQDLQQARAAAQSAQIKLGDLQRRVARAGKPLLATQAGVIGQIHATLGQIVPAGGPIVEVDDQSQVQARLGIDPAQVSRLSVGQTVELSPVNGSTVKALQTHLRLITQQVNPETQLIDVFSSLPGNGAWVLGMPVVARIHFAPVEGLMVPRAAVLPVSGHYTLFTVEHGHAVAHRATVGAQDNQRVQIAEASPPLKSGEPVVVVGNYELEDGMAVQVVGQP